MDGLNSDADLIEDLGKYLKKKREERDISLKTLASRTRIPLRFVEAMEVNHFEDLPNAVSAKGFLRSYAEFVGADYTRVLEAFSKLTFLSGSFAPTEKQDKILSYLHVKKTSRLPFPRRVTFLVGGVIILLLLVLAALLPTKEVTVKSRSSLPTLSVEALQPSKLPTPTEPPLQEIEKVDVPSLESPLEEESIINSVEESAVSEMEDSIANKSEPKIKEKFSVLSLEALEPSWVQVTIDDLEMREALLQVGDSVKWEAKEKFLLTLGNAGGVKISLDGRELDSFGPSGEVVHKEILIAETELEESE